MTYAEFVSECHYRARIEARANEMLMYSMRAAIQHHGGVSAATLDRFNSLRLWAAYWHGVASLLEGTLYHQADPNVPLTDTERALCLGQTAMRIALEGRPH